MNEAPAVEIAELRYQYPDGTAALDGIDLCVAAGERVGIIGGNGAGKSTLLLHLNGVLCDRGTVRIFGVTVNRATRQAIRQCVGLVFQNPEDQLFCPTVFDDVAFGPRNLRWPEAEVRRRVAEALSVVGLAGFEERSAFHLSLGQKKRAALATVLSMDARVLALDEPTSNVDPRARRELLTLLRGLDQTQIIATHDLEFVHSTCHRVVLIDQGRVAADGTPEQILDDKQLLEAHGL